MGRIIGNWDYIDGGQTGFTHTNEYIGNAQNGIALQCVNGGLSGIVTQDIFFWAGGALSGQAQSFLGLLSSGNITIEASSPAAGTVLVSGQNITLNAETDITIRTNSRDITWQAERDFSLIANRRDAILRSNRGEVQISTSAALGGGAIRITPNKSLQINPTEHIFITTPQKFQAFAFGTQALISGQLNTSILSHVDVIVSGEQNIFMQAGTEGNNDIWLLASGNLYGVANFGNVNLNSWRAAIAATAATDVTLTSRGGNITATAAVGNISLTATAGDINIAATGAAGNVTIVSQNKSDFNTTSTSADMGFTAGQHILLKPNAGSIICTPRTAGAQAADGKVIFSNVIANNHAPINISGVTSLASFMTGATTGDIAMQNPGNEAGPGAGRLWLNTGSGLAPISVGSGYFLAYDNLPDGLGVSVANSATILGFNTQVVRDRQYQHDPTGLTPTSGTITVTNDGLYEVTYSAGFTYTAASVTTASVIQCQIYKNNAAYNPSTAYAGNTGTTNTIRSCSATTLMYLVAGDQITLQALRATGGAARTNNNEVWILIKRLR